MMYWSDCARANDLAQFFVDFDPYSAGDAGICSEEDSTIPSEEFLFEVSYQAEHDPEDLIYQLECMREYIEEDDEKNKVIDEFIEWLETMIEQKEE